MPDDAPSTGWVRMKHAGAPADAPTAIVSAEAWRDVWADHKVDGKKTWVLVGDGEPAPTPEQVPEARPAGGKS